MRVLIKNEEMSRIGSFYESKNSQKKFTVFVSNESEPMLLFLVNNKNQEKVVYLRYEKLCLTYLNIQENQVFTKNEVKAVKNFFKSRYKYSQIFKMGELKFDVKTYWHYVVYKWSLESCFENDNLHLQSDKSCFIKFPKLKIQLKNLRSKYEQKLQDTSF